MAQKNMAPSAPILVRSYKKESILEVWKQTREGRFALLKSFPICRWSGQLGPKRRQGDRQTPEGFYSVTPRQMNPNSAYYLSFDTGYPNAFDRAHGASGSALMVHGICSSAGCYAMTNQQIGEIFAQAPAQAAPGTRPLCRGLHERGAGEAHAHAVGFLRNGKRGIAERAEFVRVRAAHHAHDGRSRVSRQDALVDVPAAGDVRGQSGRAQHVAVAQVLGAPVRQLEAHRVLHGAQVHRDVRRVRNEAAVEAEERARVVEALAHVHRDGRAL
jgi:hypothetical protein